MKKIVALIFALCLCFCNEIKETEIKNIANSSFALLFATNFLADNGKGQSMSVDDIDKANFEASKLSDDEILRLGVYYTYYFDSDKKDASPAIVSTKKVSENIKAIFGKDIKITDQKGKNFEVKGEKISLEPLENGMIYDEANYAKNIEKKGDEIVVLCEYENPFDGGKNSYFEVRLNALNNNLISIKGVKYEEEDYQKACDGGDLEACIKAGDLNLEDRADNDALELFEKACNGGNLNGCAKAGGVYRDWYGTYYYSESYKDSLPTWQKKGSELYEKACKGGIKEACNVEFGPA